MVFLNIFLLEIPKVSSVRLFEIVRQFPNPQRFAYEVSAGVTTRSLFLLEKTTKMLVNMFLRWVGMPVRRHY